MVRVSAQVGMDHEAASQVLAARLCLRTTMPTTGTRAPHTYLYTMFRTCTTKLDHFKKQS